MLEGRGTLVLMLIQGVPSEILGIPSWVLNGLSIGTLVMLIIGGLVTSRLWTKSQVDNVIERYEKHLAETIAHWKDRVATAEQRERDWQAIAQRWQEVASTLGDAIDPVHEANQAMLTILRELQRSSAPRAGRGRDGR